jgi:hypothetical protein
VSSGVPLSRASTATSSSASDRSVPATTKLPSAKRMSASAASSASAAMQVPFAMISSEACQIAVPPHIGRARAAVTAADRDPVGVTLHQPDALVRDAEPVGEDLRKGGLVTLADGLGAGDQRHGAVGFEADVDVLGGRAAGPLDVISKAETARIPARFALSAPGRKSIDIGASQGAVESLWEGAAVDGVAQDVGHRHRRGRDHVDAPQFGAIESALPGRLIDQSLDDVDRFRKDHRKPGGHRTVNGSHCRARQCAESAGTGPAQQGSARCRRHERRGSGASPQGPLAGNQGPTACRHLPAAAGAARGDTKADRGRSRSRHPDGADRFIQQAVLQKLQADWDPTFSTASFGFRPGRSAHQAVARAQEYIVAGYGWVVDIDLEKFFDRVNHDILMGLVAKRVSDRRLLRRIRGFLTAGVLAQGLVGPTDEGTPQGGPFALAVQSGA